MEQKAEELYEDGGAQSSQTTFLNRWMGIYGFKINRNRQCSGNNQKVSVSEWEDTMQTNNNGQLQLQ